MSLSYPRLDSPQCCLRQRNLQRRSSLSGVRIVYCTSSYLGAQLAEDIPVCLITWGDALQT